MYDNIMFPIMKPNITPTFPNLFNIPAINPDNAYAAINVELSPIIIPNVSPTVSPPVAPTNIPFFQPNTRTTNMLSTFLIENPRMLNFPSALIAIIAIILAPITSSIENTFFTVNSLNTIKAFTNTLYIINVDIASIMLYNKS